MQLDKKFLFAVLVFASTLLWIFFINASGFSLEQALLPSNYKETIGKLLSQSFLAALITFPLPFVFTAIATKKIEKKAARAYCTLAAAIATIASLAIFPVVAEHALVFVFYVVSFVIIAESADLDFKELKRFITPRAAGGAVKKANTLLALALFIASSLIVINNEKFVKSFEDSIISSVAPQGGGIDVSELSTNLIIQTQRQSLQAITTTQQFEKLREKQDIDVKNFVATIDAISANIDSPAYRQAILEQVKKNQGQIVKGQDFSNAFDLVKKQIPLFKTIEDYLWLLEAITIVSAFLIIANYIIAPLAMLYAIIIDKLIPRQEENPAG